MQRHAFWLVEVHITARNAAIQCTPTFHHLCYKSYIIGEKPKEKDPAILFPTRESNPKPFVLQSHLQPLDQRGIHSQHGI
uniref:SFRICE_014004 n=1 Tax=Spodoptera frugiperda TaxID=7108 RepID=A0A2H1W6V6_SPOFR